MPTAASPPHHPPHHPLPAPLSPPLPHWLRSAALAWTGAVLAALAVLLTAGFLWHEKQTLEAGELHSAELYARMLQDHAERTFDTIDIALAAAADTVADPRRNTRGSSLDADLAQAQLGLPFVRSLSLVAADGRVVASSSPGNVGALLDMARLPHATAGSTDALGVPQQGRDLADMQAGRPAGTAAGQGAPPGARWFMPLVRRLQAAPGQPPYLVAALNPDFFADAYALMLADPSRAAAIASIDGTLVAATSNLLSAPGDSIARHRAFTSFLPARDSGSFLGTGIDGGSAVTAFRALRKRPLLVVVERDHGHVLAAFRRTALWMASLCTAALLVLGALLLMAWRSLQAQALVRAALQATQAEVEQSERDLRLLVESVHELVFRANAAGQIVFVNARWSTISGWPAGHIVGRHLAQLCRPQEQAVCAALFTAARAQADTIVVHMDSQDGRPLALELSVSPVADPAGTTLGFAGFAVDVTAREAAQAALQTQLQFTAQLLELSPTPIFVKDPQGRFINVNRAWLELMDVRLPDVLGRDSADLYGAEGAAHQAHDARLGAGDTLSYENHLALPGRPARDTIVTKVRFTRADGSAAGIVGSIVDVTEFRQAERSIREARDAAESANRAKSEFIANISHELRTPLQAILGFAGLGRDLARGAPALSDLFNEVCAGGQRMLTLVNGLLDVSQMDSAVGSLPLQRQDVAGLLRALAETLNARALQRGQRLHLTGLDHAVFADVDGPRLQQALRHALANALQYAPPGSTITLDCGDHGAHGLRLTVHDTGPGFPDDELEAVFEPFAQSSRTRNGAGGAGLGLTIARKILRAHGGSIVAANAPGGGALVTITLPAACATAAASPPHGVPELAHG